MKKLMLTSLLIVGFSASLAQAGDHGFNHEPYGLHKKHIREDVQYARVTDVEPIIQTVSQQIPEQNCWNETVRYRDSNQYQSSTPAIIGGLIGATLGHSLGNDHYKTNRIIKTVALGALGASIGNDIGHKDRGYQTEHYGTERRCEVSYHTRYDQQVVGYNVEYRFRGETYRTRMDYHPGKTIPVQVNVHPIL